MDVCVQLYGGFIAGQSNIIPSMWRKGNSSQISSVSSHHYLISACAASLCCVSSAFLSFRWAFPSYNYTLLSQRINALHPTFTHFTERPQCPQAKWEIHGLQTCLLPAGFVQDEPTTGSSLSQGASIVTLYTPHIWAEQQCSRSLHVMKDSDQQLPSTCYHHKVTELICIKI